MWKAISLCVGVLLLCSFASGLGRYALAPGGAYVDYTMQGVNHDWHRYLWAITMPNAWPVLIALGAFIGATTAILVVPVGAILAFVAFWIWPSLRNRFSSWNLAWLLLIVAIAGFLSGVAQTIIAGRNPGIP
jgi:hypothetical protein